MPSEYEKLAEALKASNIPFQEYGWKTRPEGKFGIVSLDMEAASLNGDDRKLDRSWEASVDVYFPKAKDRKTVIQTIETILRQICGSSWEANSFQYEQETGLFHKEWVCYLTDDAEEDAGGGD